MRCLIVFLSVAIVLFLSFPVFGKAFCPACPEEKYIPSGMELEKIVVEKTIVNGEERILITLKKDGLSEEVAVFFFDSKDFLSQRVRAFLQSLKERYPSFHLVEGDAQNERVRAIKDALDNLFAVPLEKRAVLPCLFVFGEVLLGEREIVTRIDDLLAKGE